MRLAQCTGEPDTFHTRLSHQRLCRGFIILLHISITGDFSLQLMFWRLVRIQNMPPGLPAHFYRDCGRDESFVLLRNLRHKPIYQSRSYNEQPLTVSWNPEPTAMVWTITKIEMLADMM